jgi:phage shock protein C
MYCTGCGKNIGPDAQFCQYCGARQAPIAGGGNAVAQGSYQASYGEAKKLRRSRTDRKIAGVCAGVANYLDLDTTLVRVVWLLCLLGGFGLIAYLVCWVLMPEE